jgi:hypothetical protein
MSSHRPASGGRGAVFFPLIGDLVNRVPGGRRHVRLAAGILLLVIAALVAIGVARTRRVAAWAPVSVIASRDPLQDLPIRVAASGEAVEPAHTYDAVLDLSSIDAIVVGVDLDYVAKGVPRYDTVIRSADGSERFRDRIKEEYFADGRFMLRLFARGFPAGDYTLDIEGFDEGATDGRIVASSWFQVLR